MSEQKKYRTLTGRTVVLEMLSGEERAFLMVVVERYRKWSDWTEFAAWWMSEASKWGFVRESPVFRICDDLEARLGIAQGKVAPPDYRHCILALIEERDGSRGKFCQETGIDPKQLGWILAGDANASVVELERLLHVFNMYLAVQTGEEMLEMASPEETCNILKEWIVP